MPKLFAACLSSVLCCVPAAGPAWGIGIDDFATCTISPGTGGLSAGGDLLAATLTATPQPLCNDGTVPLMYVRRGDGGAGAPSPNWVIHTQGGGACTDFQSCIDRWCAPNPPMDAAKMSSSYAHAGITGKGIFSQNPAFPNPFADWNHVLLYYCSSDQWVGSTGGTTLLEQSPGSANAYDIHFEGHDILRVAIEMLLAGAQPDVGTFTLPPLGDAETVIFSGDSAGSGGARHNADRVFEWIESAHSNPPQLDFRLVADAAMISAPERLGAAGWQAVVEPGWTDVWIPNWHGVPDASCVAAKGGLASPTVWRCSDPNHVIAHHVEVPFFTRQDLADKVKESNSFPEFAAHVTEQLLSWQSYPDIAPPYATDSIEALSPSQGAFGPNCGSHVGIRADEPFFGQTIDVPGVGPVTYAEVLWNWITGAQPQFAVEEVTRSAAGTAIYVGASQGVDCSPLVPVGLPRIGGLALAVLACAMAARRLPAGGAS